MVISVPTTSAKLSDILSSAQITQISQFPGRKQIELQNLGANDIYVELGATATATDGRKVLASTGTFAVNVDDLSRINLISSGVVNANVRLTINS